MEIAKIKINTFKNTKDIWVTTIDYNCHETTGYKAFHNTDKKVSIDKALSKIPSLIQESLNFHEEVLELEIKNNMDSKIIIGCPKCKSQVTFIQVSSEGNIYRCDNCKKTWLIDDLEYYDENE